MKFLRFLAVASLLSSVNAWCAGAGAAALPLPEQIYPQLDAILKTAMTQSTTMLNKALDLEGAENNKVIARSNILPQLTSSFRYYQASDDRNYPGYNHRSPVVKIAYDITLSQPIFYWGERRNYARIGEIQAAIAHGQYREGYRLLAQQLRSSYLGLITQKIGVQRAHYNLDVVEKQLRQSENRWSAKVISDAEIWTIRLSAEQSHIAVERVDLEYQIARESFSRLAGIPTLTDQDIPDPAALPAYDAAPVQQLLADYLSQKEQPTWEAVSLRKQLDIEELTVANTKTRLKPKLAAVVANTQDEQSYTQNTAEKYRVNSIFAGLSVSWSIFDGFATGAAIRNSLAHRRQIENQYKDASERLARDAQNDAKLIDLSGRNMSVTDRFLGAGEGGLRKAQGDFKNGVKAEADVDAARMALFEAQVNASAARTEYFYRIGEFLGIIAEDPALSYLPAK